jgi:hypothetical protein
MAKNLYDLLGVSPEASSEQIKTAMIRLGKQYATKSQKDEVVRTQFNKIKEAYKVLSSPYLRASYDDLLRQNDQKKRERRKPWRKLKIFTLKGWKTSKRKTAQGWRVSIQKLIKGWKVGKKQAIKGLEISRQQTQKGLKASEQGVIKGLKVGEQGVIKGLKASEQGVMKGWKWIKQKPATPYLRRALIPGEKILYQAYTHWFFYLDFGAILVVMMSGYLLIFKPAFIVNSMPTVSLWVPKILSRNLLEVSVWYLGLIVLFLIGVLMLWEAFIVKQTTEFAITSRRILFKCGLINRTIIEIKLGRFESIMINQGPLGIIFDYGTITVTGMGGLKSIVPNIMEPSRFKRVLWQVLDEYVERRKNNEDYN